MKLSFAACMSLSAGRDKEKEKNQKTFIFQSTLFATDLYLLD